MNILIVKMSAIGDVIHTLPALTALRSHFPHAHISWLIQETSAEAVRGHSCLDRLLIWHRDSSGSQHGQDGLSAGFREMLRLARQLRDTRYDLLIDFHALLKSGIWVALARADRKVGFGRGMDHDEASYLFLNERIPAISMEVHALDRGLHILRSIGVPAEDVRYDFPILPENDQQADRLLEWEGLKGGEPFVAVHPMTLWPTKLWTSEGFAEVADRIAQGGARVVFTGSHRDCGALDAICRKMTRTASRLDGRTTLKTLAAVFQRARLVLSTDTGPMHIAAAVGTPVVALFGPTAPWRAGPHGPGHRVLRAALSCSPCFRRRCVTSRYEHMACMGRIKPQQVAAAVLEGL